MFGWVAAIGAGIGAVTFDLGTSACAAVAGTIYGEHKTQNQMKKKVNKFAKRLENRLKNVKTELKNDPINMDIDNNKNNSRAKTQTYGNKKYEELGRKIEEEKKNIFKDLYDLLLTERDKKNLNDAKKIIKNIKEDINSGKPLTLENVKQLYNIFAKKSWLMENFSPNIIRQNDFLIKKLMYEIIAPLDKEKSAVNEFNMHVSNDNSNIINDDKPKSLLDAIFKPVFLDKNKIEEMKKYQVFFDFLSKYSGYMDPINDEPKWNYNDCVLVEEFIKDKEFEMYEDIEELPECCKQIDKIKKIFEVNIVHNDNKNDYINRIDDILREKYKSLERQLDEICKQDKRLKDCSEELKNKIQEFKVALNNNSQALKLKNKDNIIEVDEGEKIVNLAKEIITVMNDKQARINLDVGQENLMSEL